MKAPDPTRTPHAHPLETRLTPHATTCERALHDGYPYELVACELFLAYFEAAEPESGILLVLRGRVSTMRFG